MADLADLETRIKLLESEVAFARAEVARLKTAAAERGARAIDWRWNQPIEAVFPEMHVDPRAPEERRVSKVVDGLRSSSLLRHDQMDVVQAVLSEVVEFLEGRHV